MRCPSCQGQILRIEVHFLGFVTVSFDDANQYQLTQPVTITSEWEDDSPCACVECAWTGRVGEALDSSESPAGDPDE